VSPAGTQQFPKSCLQHSGGEFVIVDNVMLGFGSQYVFIPCDTYSQNPVSARMSVVQLSFAPSHSNVGARGKSLSIQSVRDFAQDLCIFV